MLSQSIGPSAWRFSWVGQGFDSTFFQTCLRKAFLCTLNLAVTFVAVSFHIGRIWVMEQGQVALNGWSRVVGGGVTRLAKASWAPVLVLSYAHRHTLT